MIEELARRIWPYNRSLTGEDVRRTHRAFGELFDLETTEIPSGKSFFDWTVPPEWNVREAYVEGPDGARVVDFAVNNLHLMGYSVPVWTTLPLSELREKLYTIPGMPDAIPYRTSYYRRDWGFCLTQNQLDTLPEGDYRVVVDATLDEAGSMTMSEATFGPGVEVEGEGEFILIQSYTCHPSLAVNELSGPLVLCGIGAWLKDQRDLRHTYKLLFCPETIGSVAWIGSNTDILLRMKAGLIATCVGHPGPFTYKETKAPSYTDAIVRAAFAEEPDALDIRPFSPFGSDERQYNSIGLSLPVGNLMRRPYHEYDEYHSSFDDLDLMDFGAVAETVEKYIEIIRIAEADLVYRVTQPMCEPFLSRYGDFYRSTDHRTPSETTRHVKWMIHYCDGTNGIVDISRISGVHPLKLAGLAVALVEAGVLVEITDDRPARAGGE